MNEECLKLKDHTAGYQTVEDIQRVVTEAIGGKLPLTNEQLIDEVMVGFIVPTHQSESCDPMSMTELQAVHPLLPHLCRALEVNDGMFVIRRMMMSTIKELKVLPLKPPEQGDY
jgi:hypothetical protein